MTKFIALFGIVGGLAISSTNVLADHNTPEVRTVTVQAGQGNTVAVQVPDRAPIRNDAPYALTGNDAPRTEWMRVGQGGLVAVQR